MSIITKVVGMTLGIVAVGGMLLGAFDKTLPRREYFLVGGAILFVLSFMIYLVSKESPFESY